jgi:hypothetical protein
MANPGYILPSNLGDILGAHHDHVGFGLWLVGLKITPLWHSQDSSAGWQAIPSAAH